MSWPQTNLAEEYHLESKKKIGQVENCIVWFRNYNTKTIEAEVFSDLWNVMLEESGEDKC